MLSNSYTHVKLRYFKKSGKITLLLSQLPFAPFQLLVSFILSYNLTLDTGDTACVRQTVPQSVQRNIPNRKTLKARRKDTQCCSLLMHYNRQAETRRNFILHGARHRHFENLLNQGFTGRNTSHFPSILNSEYRISKQTVNKITKTMKRKICKMNKTTRVDYEISMLYCRGSSCLKVCNLLLYCYACLA